MPIPFVAHLRWHPFIGISFHDALMCDTGTPVPMKNWPYLTADVLNGVSLGSVYSDGSVVGMWGIPLVANGSDAGPFVPHIPIIPSPILDILLLITIPLGGSTVWLGASATEMPCQNLIWGASTGSVGACIFPLTPMSANISCHDYLPAPLDFVLAPNTVMVGITFVDILKALLSLAFQMALAAIMHFGGEFVSKHNPIGKFMKKRSAAKAARAGEEAAAGRVLTEGEEEAALKAAQHRAAVEEPEHFHFAKEHADEVKEKAMSQKRAELLDEKAKKAGEQARLDAFDRSRRTGVRESMDEAYEKGARLAREQGLTGAEEDLVRKAGNDAWTQDIDRHWRNQAIMEGRLKEERTKLLTEVREVERRKAIERAEKGVYGRWLEKRGSVVKSFGDPRFMKKAAKATVIDVPVKKLFFVGWLTKSAEGQALQGTVLGAPVSAAHQAVAVTRTLAQYMPPSWTNQPVAK